MSSLYSGVLCKLSICLGGEYPTQKQNQEAVEERAERRLRQPAERGRVQRMDPLAPPERHQAR